MSELKDEIIAVLKRIHERRLFVLMHMGAPMMCYGEWSNFSEGEVPTADSHIIRNVLWKIVPNNRSLDGRPIGGMIWVSDYLTWEQRVTGDWFEEQLGFLYEFHLNPYARQLIGL
jgi:hypothetical protein